MERMLMPTAVLLLFLLLLSPVPAASAAGRGSGCNVHICSQEYTSQKQRLQSLRPASHHPSSSIASSSSSSSLSSVTSSGSSDETCSLYVSYNLCMRSLAQSCKGNIEYHSVLAVVRKWMADANCNGSFHRTRQGVKSGIEYKRQQELRNKPHESKRLRRCLNEVHNFTFDHENYLQRMAANFYTRSPGAAVGSGAVSSNKAQPLDQVPPAVRRKAGSGQRDKRSHAAGAPVLAVDEDEDCDMLGDDPSAESPMSSEFLSLFEKDEEPLMCSLFGDPHLRSFDNVFQTCVCLGAWPMVDHPLFAIQVTSSRSADSPHLVSGVTRVTVLIRAFRVCGIDENLIYEVDLMDPDAAGQQDLPATFTDGTTATSNSLVKVTARSGGNVCIQMDHVKAQVCVFRLPATAYLNVIVKFKEQMDSEKRQLMLDSMDGSSLCNSGCPREAIRVEEVLDAIGVDPAATAAASSLNPGGDECDGLFGYYYLFCLFDVRIKGIHKNETFVHRFAQDMDDILVVKRNYAKSQFLSNSAASVTGSRRRRRLLSCSVSGWLLILLTSTLLSTMRTSSSLRRLT